MRVIDMYLKPEDADKAEATILELGHRVVRQDLSDLVHLRAVVTDGSPDEFLDELRGKVCNSDVDDDFYVVSEPLAVVPRREDKDEEEEEETEDEDDDKKSGIASTDEIESFISDGSRVTRVFIVMCAVSGVLAAVGLLRDSPAVLVGAMVIAPLIKPVAAAGAGAVLGRVRECLRGLALLFGALAVAALAGALVTLVTPGAHMTPSIEIRANISPFDLVIALASGVALAYALLNRDAMSMVGIVVAASLMPVAAALGAVLAFAEFDLAWGAAVTLMSNISGVIVGLLITCKLEQVKRGVHWHEDETAAKFAKKGMIIGVACLVVLVGINVQSHLTKGIAASAGSTVAIESQVRKEIPWAIAVDASMSEVILVYIARATGNENPPVTSAQMAELRGVLERLGRGDAKVMFVDVDDEGDTVTNTAADQPKG